MLCCRSERTRWIDAIMPAQTTADNERIYDYWGKCIASLFVNYTLLLFNLSLSVSHPLSLIQSIYLPVCFSLSFLSVSSSVCMSFCVSLYFCPFKKHAVCRDVASKKTTHGNNQFVIYKEYLNNDKSDHMMDSLKCGKTVVTSPTPIIHMCLLHVHCKIQLDSINTSNLAASFTITYNRDAL